MPFFLVQFGSYLGMLRKVFVTLRCSCLFTCAAVKCKINTSELNSSCVRCLKRPDVDDPRLRFQLFQVETTSRLGEAPGCGSSALSSSGESPRIDFTAAIHPERSAENVRAMKIILKVLDLRNVVSLQFDPKILYYRIREGGGAGEESVEVIGFCGNCVIVGQNVL
ncbi:hypothetical protein ABVT39_025762 [Epinephelus coioides]